MSGLGIARCSRDWTWKSFTHPGSRSFTSVVCRRCLNLWGAGKRGPGLPLTAVRPCISERVHPETRRVPPRQSAVPKNFSADVGTLRIPAWSPSPLPLPAGHSCQQPLLSSACPWPLMLISGQLMLTELSLLKVSCSLPVSFTRLIYVGFPQILPENLAAALCLLWGSQNLSELPLVEDLPPSLTRSSLSCAYSQTAGQRDLPLLHHPHSSETPFKCLWVCSVSSEGLDACGCCRFFFFFNQV